MAHRPTFAEYIEQELQLAVPLFGELVDAVLTHWRGQPPSRLASDMDALRVLHQQRADFVRHAAHSLQEHALGRSATAEQPGHEPGRLKLALVDDDEISADIEIARVVERANTELEEPLRELRTYTSALLGDVNTARDTNPLRPEAWVRATMAAARAMPMSRNMQTLLLRTAAPALIAALARNYATVCARLRAQGVAPSMHRTVVNEGVVTELSEAMRVRRTRDRDEQDRQQAEATEAAETLTGSLEDLLLRLEQGLTARPAITASMAPPDSGRVVAAAYERRAIERLSALYDAILADRRLSRESLPLLSRLYPAVLRQTLADPLLLDDPAHPVWRCMDHLSFLVQTHAVVDAASNLALARGLVEQLVGQHSTDPHTFLSAVHRLEVLGRQRFARAVAAAGADIAALGAGTHAPPTGPLGFDADGPNAATEQTPLRRSADAQPLPPHSAGGWRAGSWLTLFMRGQWRHALVLWRAPPPGPLLLLDASEVRHWALRPAALERLAQAGLARTLALRSLVHDASGRIGQVARDPGPTRFD